MRSGTARPVLDDRASDRERVDLIGLTRPALPFAGSAHPMRRDAHDPLACCQQRLLEAIRDGPAVLDRPYPLRIEASRPAQRCLMAGVLGLDLTLTANAARSIVHPSQRVAVLVRVRPDHDHAYRPFDWLTTDEADLGGQTSVGAVATLLSSHAEGPRAATGDETHRRSGQPADRRLESQPAASPRTNRKGRTAPTKIRTMTLRRLVTATHNLLKLHSHWIASPA